MDASKHMKMNLKYEHGNPMHKYEYFKACAYNIANTSMFNSLNKNTKSMFKMKNVMREIQVVNAFFSKAIQLVFLIYNA